MKNLGLILTFLLLSAANLFAGTETLTVAAAGEGFTAAFPVFQSTQLYTVGQATGTVSLVGLDVDLQLAADPAGPWVAAAPAVPDLLQFTDAVGPFDETLEDAPRALTGALYARYRVDNGSAAEATVVLSWGTGGDSLKAGLGGSRARLFKRSVGSSGTVALAASGSSTLAPVYTKGYDYLSAFVGGGATGAGTLTLQRSAEKTGPWFDVLTADAWVAGTEEAHFFAVDGGDHYYRAVLTDTSAAANSVPFRLHPR